MFMESCPENSAAERPEQGQTLRSPADENPESIIQPDWLKTELFPDGINIADVILFQEPKLVGRDQR